MKVRIKTAGIVAGILLAIGIFIGASPQAKATSINTNLLPKNIAAVEACDKEWYNPLSWLFCGVVDAIDGFVDDVDRLLYESLTFDSERFFVTQPEYREAWSIFRYIALSIVVIGALIMTISHALGLEILDAYTIKKTLPRLLIASLAIAISWPLLRFAVELFNTIGVDIRHLIYSPFSSMPFDLDTSTTAFGGAALAGGLLFMGIWGMLSFLATAALALVIGFLIIALRDLGIQVLIILSPIAFACYILPNTQKIWKFWSTNFFGLLLLFPLVSAVVAVGRVFAAISSTGTSDLGQLIGFVSYFLPYFFLPMLAKMATGALGALSGMMNDSSRGMFDRLKNYRGKKVAHNSERMKNFSRFSEKSRLGRAANNTLGAIANPGSMLRGRSGVRARRSSLQSVHGQNAMKNDPVYQANQFDDNFQLALANEELARQKLAADRAKYDKARESGDTAGMNSARASMDARQRGLDAAKQIPWDVRNTRATRMAALDNLTKTGYQFAAGEEGYAELDSTVRSIVGGDERARAQMMDSSQYNLRAHGQRFDLGGINHGAGYNLQAGLDKGSLYELAGAKAESIQAWGSDLSAKPLSMDHAVAYKELRAMLPNAKGGNQKEIQKQINMLESMGVESYMNHAGTPTSGPIIKDTRVAYDPATSTGWSAAEQAQGWRIEPRQISAPSIGDIADSMARVYERPDPNKM